MAGVKFHITDYQAFRGVDCSTSPAIISDEHASDLLNMFVGADGVIQKRPGWRILHQFDDGINGIHYLPLSPGNGTLFIHVGTKLYRVLMTTAWRHFTGEDTPYFKTITDIPTMDDVQMIRDYVTQGIEGIEPWQVKNMDINGDGLVTMEDAQVLFDFISNLAGTTSNGVLSSSYETIKLKDSDDDLELANTKSVSLTHEGKLYILDGSKYYVVEPEYASITNLLNTTTLYEGVIQQDGSYANE